MSGNSGNPEAIRLAALAETEGRLDAADRLLVQATEIDPRNATAFDSLIRIAHRRGDMAGLARALLGRLSIEPERGDLWNDLGVALERLGQTDRANQAYCSAIIAEPALASALMNAAVLAFGARSFHVVLSLAGRAAAAGAPAGRAWLAMGHAHQSLGDAELCERAYKRSMAVDPIEISALDGFAAVRRQQGDHRRALVLLRRSISPTVAITSMTLANLAEAYRSCDEPDKASAYGRRALVVDPRSALASNNLGLAFSDLGLYASATCWATRSVHLAPSHAGFLINLGIACKAEARFTEAERVLRRGLAVRTNDANGHMALATTLLADGQVKAGLAEYEWRQVGVRTRYDLLPAPRWTGERVNDGKLLVWGEQGLGDEIMFVQFVRLLEGMADKVVVECDPRLVSMFARSFPQIDFIERTQPPDRWLFDDDIRAQVALCSLPHLLDLNISQIKSKHAFLKPNPQRLTEMRSRVAAFAPEGALRVGIAWRTLHQTPTSRRVHTALLDWRSVLSVPDITFINLQYGDCRAELDQMEKLLGGNISVVDGLDLFNDLEGGLALGGCLDLVISTTTSAYCLPAAAGIETWLLLARIDYLAFGQSEWPLAPKSRGFLRLPQEDWSKTMMEAADALRELQISRGSTNSKLTV